MNINEVLIAHSHPAVSGGDYTKVEFENYYTHNEITKIDSLISLPTSHYYRVGGSVGNYAVFAGGGTSFSDPVASVIFCDTSFTFNLATPLSSSRYSVGSANNGAKTHIIFAGGIIYSGASSVVDAYDASLTRTVLTSLSGNRAPASSTVGDYAIFAGGVDYSGLNIWSNVDAYDNSLTRVVATSLASSRGGIMPASFGNKVIFAGGTKSNGSFADVDVYDSSLVRSAGTALSAARGGGGSGVIGGYALIAGGYAYSSTYYDLVEMYNTSLTKTTGVPLSSKRNGIVSIPFDNYLLFSNGTQNFDAYDSTYLYRTMVAAPSIAPNSKAMFQNYAVLVSISSPSSAQVYSDKKTIISIPQGSKYKFDEETEQVANENVLKVYYKKVNGYIKYKSGKITM